MPADTPQAARDRGAMLKVVGLRCSAGWNRSPSTRSTGRCCPGLHQQGQVFGRGPDVLYVRFAGERQLFSVPPGLLRLLTNEPTERWW
jgi:hypothetical protein